MKNYTLRYKQVKLLSFLVFFSICGYSILAAPGDFVKDIKIEELNFKIPEVKKEDLNSDLKYYSIYSDKFPLTYLEISFYAGEADTNNTHYQPHRIQKK
jgi:hypothetical protein